MMTPFKFMFMIFISLVLMILMFSSLNTANAHTTDGSCVIQKIYTPNGETLLETKMVCRDGNVGPSYWELFAEFYYSGVSEQEYCRYVKGNNIFNIPKKVCLNKDGTWRY
tara:strand:+ start:83 stop:412 length:330 start_codon:yes stop_codon:yes gene_type:complete